MKWAILAAAACLACTASETSAELSKAEIDSEYTRLASSRLLLRPRIGSSRTAYVQLESGEATYVHDRSRIFGVDEATPVFVLPMSGTSTRLEIRIKSPAYGTGLVIVHAPIGARLTLGDLRVLLSEIFDSAEDPSELSGVIGNIRSKIAHVRGANHLPQPADRELMASSDEAWSKGYSACQVCFRRVLPISGFEIERRLGEFCAAHYRTYHPVVPDDSLHHRLRLVGDRVLALWPVPLRGYSYRFYAVDGDDANACACPGGEIFVTTGLMRLVESDTELEAVVAHEIAHVERRHGYMKYRSLTRGKLVSTIVGLAVGPVTARPDMVELVRAIGEVATAIAVVGYGRDHEEEADSYASAYLMLKLGVRDSRPLVTMLRKLKYEMTFDGLQGMAISTHPAVDERILKVQGATIDTFPRNARFVGVDKDGNEILVLRLEALASFDYLRDVYGYHLRDGEISSYWGEEWTINERPRKAKELQVFATVEATAALRKPMKVGTLVVKSKAGEYRFKNAGNTEVGPLETVGVNFIREGPSVLLPEDVLVAGLWDGGVERWSRVADDGF